MGNSFSLRPLQPTDGPAVEILEQQTPDTGAVGFYTHYLYDLYAARLALQPTITGVVAETPEHDGLIGIGWMTFGQCLVEGELYPYAYLTGLSVHPSFRQRGIASAIAAWRVETARARFGDDGVIFAGVQAGNIASLRTAEKWANQRQDSCIHVAINPMRKKPPKSRAGVVIRPAQPEELEEISQLQNEFYQDFNLYPPKSAQQLQEWLARRPFGHQINRYYVATDPEGHLLAGLGITNEGLLMTNHVVRMPFVMRVANALLRILPADGVGKRLNGHWLWFLPGHEPAAQFLWESVRWLERDNATITAIFFDIQGPVARVVSLPRFMPARGGSLLLQTPIPLQDSRFAYTNNIYE